MNKKKILVTSVKNVVLKLIVVMEITVSRVQESVNYLVVQREPSLSLEYRYTKQEANQFHLWMANKSMKYLRYAILT